MTEEWRIIPAYENYEASNLGRIKTKKRMGTNAKILKQQLGADGYPRLCVRSNGIQKTIRVHQLIAMAFLGYERTGTHDVVVDHVDNVKLNNHVSNLQLTTSRVNNTKDLKGGTSIYPGVHFKTDRQKWIAKCKIRGKTIYLGSYDKEIEASLQYQNFIQTL